MRTVVGAILVDDLAAPTRVLAARRTSPAALAGRWEFPGGKVEPGEEPDAALVRELAEELGVAVALGPELTRPDGQPWLIEPGLRLRLWFGLPRHDPVTSSDHDRLHWLSAAELTDVDWLDADRDAVAVLAPLLNASFPTSAPDRPP